MRLALPSIVRFVRQQIVYILIAVIVGAVFWAIGLPMNPATVLVFTFCIGNLLSPGMESGRSLFSERQFPYNWLIFLTTLLVLTFRFT